MPQSAGSAGDTGGEVFYRVDGPDPWDAVPELTSAEPAPASGVREQYRGRRRRPLPTTRRTARWGTVAVLVAVSLVLVGSSVLARALSEPSTLPLVVPPTPERLPLPSSGTAEGEYGDRPPAPARQGVAPVPSPRPEQPAEPSPPTPSPELADACQVDIEVQRWFGAFRATYTVANQGEPWDGWTATFHVRNGVTHEFGSDAVFSQDGNLITATNVAENAEIGTGETVVFGHRGSHTRRVGISDFAVNGVLCTVL